MKENKEMKSKEETIITKMQKLQIEKLKEKGITLIALVVTIIILLILAGVTLNLALSGNGLFSRAQNAAERYKKAQEGEEEEIRQIATQMYSEYVGAFVTGYNPKTSSDPCTIGIEASGHTEAQEFTTDENMKWRIWDFDGNTVRLISEKPTTANLTLTKVNGYNNGVWAINEICRECYSNGEPGVTVRNLRRSDIQKVSTYDYTKYKHNKSGDGAWKEVLDNGDDENLIKFGEEKKYTTNHKYPEMWGNYDSKWDMSSDPECEIWEKENTGLGEMNGSNEGEAATQFKQSYYWHQYLNKENEFINSKYYDMLFKDENGNYFGKTYWLAGRSVLLYEDYCRFGLQNVDANSSSCDVSGDDVVFCDR